MGEEKGKTQPTSKRRKDLIMRRLFASAIAASLLTGTALAVPPDEQLSDPALEAQARDISKELRCLVCQNQSIDDSDAELAKDLRRIVRERLEAGDNEAQIKDYVVDRYGEFVLLKPRLNKNTLLLWGSPLLFVLIGIGFAGYTLRRKGGVDTLEDDSATPLKDKGILERLRDN